MADEQKPGAGAGTEPPAITPTPADKKEPEKKPDPPKADPPKGEAKADEKKPEEKPQPHQVGDEDEIPEKAELLQMSQGALTKRLTRYAGKALREAFGTDDIAKIKGDLQKLKDYDLKAEEERRKNLSDLERAAEDKRKAEARATAAEERLQRQMDTQTFKEFDSVAFDAIGKHFDPKFKKFAERELKDYVAALDDKEAPSDPKGASKVFEKWAEKYVKENPGYAKPVETPPEPEKKKILLGTGADPNAKPDQKSDGKDAEKTARPNAPNSMSKAEYAAHKRRLGITA